jgi:hypothetical protein
VILNLDDIESLTHGRKWASRSIRIAGPRTRKAAAPVTKAAAPVAPEFPVSRPAAVGYCEPEAPLRTNHGRPSGASMPKIDAVALLKTDHRKVEDLFESFEKARHSQRKRSLV